jgi:hypothetical protein
LTTDAYDNSWIVFVNSEGLKKSPPYEEDFSYQGNGTVQLAIVDREGNVIRNGPLATEILQNIILTLQVQWQNSPVMD